MEIRSRSQEKEGSRRFEKQSPRLEAEGEGEPEDEPERVERLWHEQAEDEIEEPPPERAVVVEHAREREAEGRDEDGEQRVDEEDEEEGDRHVRHLVADVLVVVADVLDAPAVVNFSFLAK